MIKASDLRIGNLIFPRQGIEEYVTVTDIDEDGMIGTTAFFYDGKGTTGTVSEAARGIPLTPEWLGRCMFEKDSRNVLVCRIDEYSLLGLYADGKYELIDIHNAESVKSWDNRIEFLHQLQNLYHGLVGEELTIKETV